MKVLSFVLIFILIISFASNISITMHSLNDHSFSKVRYNDKFLHSVAGFCMAIFVASSTNFENPNIDSLSSSSVGIFSGIFLGFSKEYFVDKYFGGDVEYLDFVYTSYGASIGGLVFFLSSEFFKYLNIPPNFTNSLISLTGLSLLISLANIEFKF
jgi:hypothetical protein